MANFLPLAAYASLPLQNTLTTHLGSDPPHNSCLLVQLEVHVFLSLSNRNPSLQAQTAFGTVELVSSDGPSTHNWEQPGAFVTQGFSPIKTTNNNYEQTRSKVINLS